MGSESERHMNRDLFGVAVWGVGGGAFGTAASFLEVHGVKGSWSRDGIEGRAPRG